MLKRLEIQNYAIIESLDLNLENGLSIVTGETGAGKSILLGALGLIMGKRADSKVLFNTDQKCIVEATYDISQYNLQPFFAEEELDYDHETIIRRVISTSGKSRAFINDEPTTLSVLKDLNEYLVDLHQQFDMLDIHKVSFQTNTLDAIAGNKDAMEVYQEGYAQYRKKLNTLKNLEEKESNSLQEMDFLNYQMKEFTDVGLLPGEQEEKEQLLQKLSAAEEIQQVTTSIAHQLENDEININDQIQAMVNDLSSLIETDHDIASMYERLISVKEELRDIAKESTKLSENIEYDEELISELNTRLSLIYKLQKKHNAGTLEELIDIQNDIKAKLNEFEDISGEINKTKAELAKIAKELESQAKDITAKRKKAAPSFEKKIHEMLVPLSMENAYIKVDIIPLDKLSPSGLDEVNFLFSPNKGSSFKNLKDIASGGEISRLTLCIKALVADAVTLPTLIFDEIDTGVSGDVAGRMGEILHRLAHQHQVISITHSPQIASKADHHFFVHKEDKTDRTVTAIRHLDKEGRIYELAKMLSTDPPSEAAIANAKELLQAN